MPASPVWISCPPPTRHSTVWWPRVLGCNTPLSTPEVTDGCPGATYAPWDASPYVLPVPVGITAQMDLTNCSGSFHSAGQPDQFAMDFRMSVGTVITAARAGRVVTRGQFSYPYASIPVTFRNTRANERGLLAGERYMALEY